MITILQREVAIVTDRFTDMGLEEEETFIALFVNASTRFS